MKILFRSVSFFVLIAFVATSITLPTKGFAANTVLGLPVPGTMVNLSAGYVPMLIKGLKVHPDNPLLFDFIVDTGNTGINADSQALRDESQKLIKYFLATLATPDKDLWVNLSPYEKNRIIPNELGQTIMGRDMLAQDYMLKQITASLIYPEKEVGRKFWDKVYTEAQTRFGTSEIPVNTFNKVWILPDQASVFVRNNTAYVVKAHLKVMLEGDYLAAQKHEVAPEAKTSQIVREIVLPALEKEVNEGKNFASIRQVFNSLILASWYKKNLKQALLNQVYSDKSNINGVNVADTNITKKIYEQYLTAYKKGVFNYIKEDVNRLSKQPMPKKYFSGGEVFGNLAMTVVDHADSAQLFPVGSVFGVNTKVDAAMTNPREATAATVLPADFQELVALRQSGKAGFHLNVNETPIIPASEKAVENIANISKSERERLQAAERRLYAQNKIGEIVMAGGEATRFGGPKTFVEVSPELGEFLNIKAANLRWVREQFGTNIPLYILSSEKRLAEFKDSLRKRNFYGMDPETFQWYVQGVMDTFIPTDEEIEANFKGDDVQKNKAFAQVLRKQNPDGIYRFNGERRLVPGGHFDAIASFIISGRLTDALKRGIEYAPVFNIDNLQAVLKNDGLIAHFAEEGYDFGFILAEKNLTFSIKDKVTGKDIVKKLIVRFRDNVLSFDGLTEFKGETVKDGLRFVINQESKKVDVFDASGQLVETEQSVKAETGGTLVQPVDEDNNPIGDAIMREGFELKSDFPHADAPFFNTNTIIVRLRSLLKFMDVTEEQLAGMSFQERSKIVRERLVKKIKPNFEFKNHEVEGEFPELGVVKDGKTKIPVVQLTRIMLQVAHIPGAKVGYYYAPRASVFAPVKEPEDKPTAAANNINALRAITDYGKGNASITDSVMTSDEFKVKLENKEFPLDAVFQINYEANTGEKTKQFKYQGHLNGTVTLLRLDNNEIVAMPFAKIKSVLVVNAAMTSADFYQMLNHNPKGLTERKLMVTYLDPTSNRYRKEKFTYRYDQNNSKNVSVVLQREKTIGYPDTETFVFEGQGNRIFSAYVLADDSAMTIETKSLAKTREVKFGTSGDRGITEWPEDGRPNGDFNLPLVRRITQGIATYNLQTTTKTDIIIGHDTRYRNPEFSKEEARILAGNGFTVYHVIGSVPTPVLAYWASTRQNKVAGVVNGTASHSPYTDNGIKFSPSHGGAADTKTTDEIQALANEATEYHTANYEEAVAAGRIIPIKSEELVAEYVNDYLIPTLRATVAPDGKSAWDDIVKYIESHPTFNVVVDPMQGTGVETVKLFYGELAKAAGRNFFNVIHEDNNDAKFTQTGGAPQPAGKYIQGLINDVKTNPDTLGIAQDGDVDRFGVVDFNGDQIEANDMVALFAYFLNKEIGLTGAVVKTVATSNFSFAVADHLGLEKIETPVGFKYTVEHVNNGKKVLVGGEESAHVGVLPFMKSWDDGFAVGITALWLVARTGKSLSEYKALIEKEIGKSYKMKIATLRDEEGKQKAKAIAMINEAKAELAKQTPLKEIGLIQKVEVLTGQSVVGINTMDGIKLTLENGDSILLRPSGTEPAAKLYAEVSNPSRLDALFAAAEKLMSDNAQVTIDPNDEDFYLSKPSSDSFTRGGIDLNTQNLNTQISGENIKMNFDPAMIARFKRGDFTGIQVQILGVTRLQSVLPLFGMTP